MKNRQVFLIFCGNVFTKIFIKTLNKKITQKTIGVK